MTVNIERQFWLAFDKLAVSATLVEEGIHVSRKKINRDEIFFLVYQRCPMFYIVIELELS